MSESRAIDETKFLDVYADEEMRRIYAEMFPGCLFDEDCWFPFGEVGGTRLLFDGSLSLAMKDPEATHYPFYSEKGEKRIRAVQERCTFRKREFIDSITEKPKPTDLPVSIGVTRGRREVGDV